MSQNALKTNIKLGDDGNYPLKSTYMSQISDYGNQQQFYVAGNNRYIGNGQKSNFSLGEGNVDFRTKYNLEYYDKSGSVQRNFEGKDIENKMRGQTILGSDKPDLITEHAAEYTKKEIDRGIYHSRSQSNIQKEHEDLIGKEKYKWDTTNRQTYTPKKNENDPNLKINMQKSNLSLGDDKNTKRL